MRLVLNVNEFNYIFTELLNIMDKKELKFYEAPACELVELNVVSTLLAGSTTEGVEDEGDITGGNGDITW